MTDLLLASPAPDEPDRPMAVLRLDLSSPAGHSQVGDQQALDRIRAVAGDYGGFLYNIVIANLVALEYWFPKSQDIKFSDLQALHDRLRTLQASLKLQGVTMKFHLTMTSTGRSLRAKPRFRAREQET